MRATALKPVVIAALFVSVAARADTHSEIADVLADMTGALVDDNAAAFLKPIDKKCPDYDKLSTYIPELLKQGAVSSSIAFLKEDGDDARRTVELDWYLEIHNEGPSGPVTQRRKAIDCVFEKQGRKWRIVSLFPSSFFAPQNYE